MTISDADRSAATVLEGVRSLAARACAAEASPVLRHAPGRIANAAQQAMADFAAANGVAPPPTSQAEIIGAGGFVLVSKCGHCGANVLVGEISG